MSAAHLRRLWLTRGASFQLGEFPSWSRSCMVASGVLNWVAVGKQERILLRLPASAGAPLIMLTMATSTFAVSSFVSRAPSWAHAFT
eukprot:5979902-Lingulodinium_polyedra.AAC.1